MREPECPGPAWIDDVTVVVEFELAPQLQPPFSTPLAVPMHSNAFYRIVRIDSFGNRILLAGNLCEANAEAMRSSVNASGDVTVLMEAEPMNSLVGSPED